MYLIQSEVCMIQNITANNLNKMTKMSVGERVVKFVLPAHLAKLNTLLWIKMYRQVRSMCGTQLRKPH